jgi:DnaK suppressor protein
VTHFAATRARLAAHRAELERRLDRLEAALEAGAPGGRPAAEDPALAELLEGLNSELGLVESAIRRIDSRSYDCCMQCGSTLAPDRLERLPYSTLCESCSRDFPSEYAQHLRARHESLRRRLLGLVSRMQALALECERAEAGAAATLSTRVLLTDLAHELPQRFARAEQGGYLRESLAAAPHFSALAARLQAQHAHFGSEMADIARAATAADQSAPAWHGLCERFRQLSHDLLAHDEQESEILERAFLDDMGGAD